MKKDVEKKFVNCIVDGKLTDEGRKILSEMTPKDARQLIERHGVLFDTDVTPDDVFERIDATRKKIKKIEEKALSKIHNKKPDGDGPDTA